MRRDAREAGEAGKGGEVRMTAYLLNSPTLAQFLAVKTAYPRARTPAQRPKSDVNFACRSIVREKPGPNHDASSSAC